MPQYSTQNFKCCGINEIIGINRVDFSFESLLDWMLQKFLYAANAQKSVETAGRAAYIFTLVIKPDDVIPDADYEFDFHIYNNRYYTPAQAKVFITNFREWITTNDFGTLKSTPASPNPNKDGKTHIRTLIWTPNNENLIQYCKNHNITPNNPYTTHQWWINGN